MLKLAIIELNDVDFYKIEFLYELRNSGGINVGIVTNHILVIRSSDENIKQYVMKLQRGKKAKFAKVYKLDYMVYIL
jgi:hypothetical protein